MARTNYIELGEGQRVTQIPILYEDRSVIAIDKPTGWMLVPFSWQRTQRNLQAAITSSIAGGQFWARCRNLKFLRHVHRLDAETTGVLLMAKSSGAVNTYSDLFESRKMAKTYLVVVEGTPAKAEWTCDAPLAPDPKRIGAMMVDRKNGKSAETAFRVLQTAEHTSLIEARPVTGRTHQIRLHLQLAGHVVVGDELYSRANQPLSTPLERSRHRFPLALRAIRLEYFDPFQRKPVRILAPDTEFLKNFGWT